MEDQQRFIEVIFLNPSRIRNIQRFNTLAFDSESQKGKYLLLAFDTFSAAKKTLETFQDANWFGIDKYWVDTRDFIVA